MPPKKGKKKKGKKVKAPPIEYMPQMDKAFYETEISGIKDKIKLYKDQYSWLEEENIDLIEKITYLKENRTDELAKCSMYLRDKVIQCRQRKYELKRLRELKKQEAIDHKTKLGEMQETFEEMVKRRSNANKLLKSHLNVLHIYRDNQVVLKQTVEDLADEFNDREKIHKEKIRREKLKFRSNRIAVQDNLIQKLLWSSANAEKVVDGKVPFHIERLARENFALESEIDRVTLLNKQLEQRLIVEHEKKREFREQVHHNWVGNINTAAVVRSNVRAIIGMSNKFDRVQYKGDKLRKREINIEEIEEVKANVDAQQRNSLQVLHGLRQYLNVQAYEHGQLNTKLAMRKKELAKLNNVLYKIKLHSQMIKSFASDPRENIFSCAFNEVKFREDQFMRFSDIVLAIVAGVDTKISGFSVSTMESVDIEKSVSDVASEEIAEELIEVYDIGEVESSIVEVQEEVDEILTPPVLLRKSSMRTLSRVPIIDFEVDDEEPLVFEDDEPEEELPPDDEALEESDGGETPDE